MESVCKDEEKKTKSYKNGIFLKMKNENEFSLQF